MSRRERIVTAVALATLLLWQTYAVYQGFRFAPNLARLMAGVGEPLPWATRSFFATYRAWPLVPLAFGGLSLDLFRRKEPSEIYLVLLLIGGAMAALVLQAWVHEAFFAPLFTVLEKIG